MRAACASPFVPRVGCRVPAARRRGRSVANVASIAHRVGMSAMTNAQYLSTFGACVPRLDDTSHKGQAGRVAVVGGSIAYTGAPFFSAMAAMRGGADLAFVFCPPDAAPIIKAYSPDLIVYPGFGHIGPQCDAFDRMHALVVGPGLGRDRAASLVFEQVLTYAIRSGSVLVVDADALWILHTRLDLLKLISAAESTFALFLTPNKMELQRLLQTADVDHPDQLVEFLNGNVIIVAKGQHDLVLSKSFRTTVDSQSSLKRVGGLGDILSGLLAVYAFWMLRDVERTSLSPLQLHHRCVAAAVAACSITRLATHNAFLQHRHGFVASDALSFINHALDTVVGSEPDRQQ
ncbi:unnamed protein product [Agarophyton chilense]